MFAVAQIILNFVLLILFSLNSDIVLQKKQTKDYIILDFSLEIWYNNFDVKIFIKKINIF